MAYTKTTWVDNSDPAITAARLNKIEQGIYDAQEAIENIDTSGVFVAINGQTTFSEISQAIQAGKVVVAWSDTNGTNQAILTNYDAANEYAAFFRVKGYRYGSAVVSSSVEIWELSSGSWSTTSLPGTAVIKFVYIYADNWGGGTTCTKAVTGIAPGTPVIVAPMPNSRTTWENCGVYWSSQGAGTLTFKCTTTPTTSITVAVSYTS